MNHHLDEKQHMYMLVHVHSEVLMTSIIIYTNKSKIHVHKYTVHSYLTSTNTHFLFYIYIQPSCMYACISRWYACAKCTLSFSSPLSLSLSRSLSVYLSLSRSLALYLALSRSLCISLSLSPSLFLLHFLSLPPSLSIYLSPSLSLSLSQLTHSLWRNWPEAHRIHPQIYTHTGHAY